MYRERLRLVIGWAAVSAALSVAACRPAGKAEVAPARESSVKPGINEEYFKNPDIELWTGRFEGESREIYRERQSIVAASGAKPGMTVADIGAGTGFFSMMFARAVGPAGRVCAVDIIPEFLVQIEQRARGEGLGNVTTVRCKEDSVELAANSIDLAFVCDTYHHFEYPRSTMTTVYRALRPGGRLVIVDFIRIDGVSRQWVLDHVRAGRETVQSEIEAAGFRFVEAVQVVGLAENYFLRFEKPR